MNGVEAQVEASNGRKKEQQAADKRVFRRAGDEARGEGNVEASKL